MKQLQAKLKSRRGETLVEVLASILVATLSVGLLLGAVAVSAHLNHQAEGADEIFYEALTAAESRAGSGTGGTVTITEGGRTAEIPVQIYGDEDLYAYAIAPAGGDAP